VVDSRKRLGQIWSYETYTIKAYSHSGYLISKRSIPSARYVTTIALEVLFIDYPFSIMSSRRADRYHVDLSICMGYDQAVWD
jgi:hypothetical protein